MNDNRFSTFSLSILWLMVFLSLWYLMTEIFNVPSYQEQGFPNWLVIAWVAIPAGLLSSTIAILLQRKVGGYGLMAALLLMIPATVAINYFALQADQPEELTAGWFVTTTLIITIIVAFLGTGIFLAIRNQWPGFR